VRYLLLQVNCDCDNRLTLMYITVKIIITNNHATSISKKIKQQETIFTIKCLMLLHWRAGIKAAMHLYS